MSEKRILTAKCPNCAATLQVKTRAAEKTVVCPKCQMSMTVSAAAGAAPAELPFAAMIDQSPPPLPMAEPLSAMPMAEPLTLPFAQPLATLAPRSQKRVAIAGGIGGTVLVAVVLLIVFRSGDGQAVGPPAATGGPAVQPGAAPTAAEVSEIEEDGSPLGGQAAVGPMDADQGADQGGNVFETISNAQLQQGAKNPANNFPQGGFQQGGGFPSVGNTQQRDWDLANRGRLGAMGLKKIQVPRR